MAKEKSPEEKNQAHYEKAGPTLLAMQPSEPKGKGPSTEKIREWGLMRGHLEALLISLRNWRQSWWTQNWSDLAQYIDPKRSTWLTQSTGGTPSPNNMTRGKPINTSIVDPTATYAVRVCSSGLMSGLASPSRPWFKVIPSLKSFQLDSAARQWLDALEDMIYTILAGSNFYNSFAQECEDLVVFGTSPVITYEDERDLLRCYNPVVGEYYLSSGSTLRVEGLYRQFLMTVKQVVDFFGIESCPADIVKLWGQKGSGLEQECIIAHAIEPNYEISGTGIGKIPGNFTWREVYWIYGSGSEKLLSIRGFVEQPFTASRWSTQSNDAYGRSVGMDVLPDVIQLQVETLRKAEAIEKQVRPPMVASIELKNQPSSILPGHVTYVSNLGPGTGMRPMYEVTPDIRGMMEDLAAIQQRIKTGFFNDLFLMLEQPDMNDRKTAYEVAQKMQEKLNVLGPVIENIITESLKPRLKRVFSIIKRKGMMPPPPDSLKGLSLDVEFISMLALAQKAAATGGIERLVGLVGNMAAVYPGVSDVVDAEMVVREMNDLLGNPAKILRGPEDLAKMRAGQQQQAQGAQQAAAVAHTAQTAKTGAQAAQVLSNTEVGAGATALQQLIGG